MPKSVMPIVHSILDAKALGPAIAKHFELQAPEEEPKGPTDKNGKPKKPKPAPPPYEPPPVQTESGKLAFEVERVLDVRAIPMYVCACVG